MAKSKNLIKEYENFIIVSNKIYKIFLKTDIAFSPLLNIAKPTTETLKNRRKIIKAVAKQKYFPYFLCLVPRLLLGMAVPLCHHFIYLRSFKKFKSLKLVKAKTIFLSHNIGQEMTQSEDFYFGDLPRRGGNFKQDIILYINHTKNQSFKFENVVHEKSIKNKILLPKTVCTQDFFKTYLDSFKKSIKIFFLIINKKAFNKGEKILIFELAMHQLSIERFAQMYLFKNITLILRKTKARNILVTYEGHGYESYLVDKLHRNFGKLNIAVYQFAPIVSSQHSFFRNLNYLNKKTIIYVTGPKVKSIILQTTNIKSDQVVVLGSKKNNGGRQISIAKKPVSFLLAAEGSNYALSEFIDLGYELALDNPNTTFIVRAHPASAPYKFKLFKKVKGKLSNLVLSEKSLEKELSRVSYCIYRSSAAAIEGLKYGVLPIHFGELHNFHLDPIELIGIPHLQTNDLDTLKLEITQIIKRNKSSNINLTKIYVDAFEEYFAPLNYYLLENHD